MHFILFLYKCITQQCMYMYSFYHKKLLNTFIQQRRIKLIKSDSKCIYNATKDFYFK